MKKSIFILLSIICCFLVSCDTYKTVSIDYMMPGKLHFPEELKNVGVIVHMTKTDNEPLRIQQEKTNNGYTEHVSYKGIPETACEALAQSLANANYFDEVIICDSVIPGEGLLEQNEVKNLTEELGVDFLLSLEDFDVDIQKQTSYVYSIGYINSIDMIAKPQLCVYIPQKKKPLLHIQPQDSLYQEQYTDELAYAIELLSENDFFLEDASYSAGETLAQYIAPYWENAERIFFKGGSANLRDATIYIKEKQYSKAIDLWEYEFDKSRKKDHKLYAALNLVLFYEMSDNLDDAIKWCKRAMGTAEEIGRTNERVSLSDNSYVQFTAQYLEELENRKESQGKLEIQMNRFQSNF